MIISAKVRQQTREDIYARKFRNLPLSAKFVFKILEYNGLFTQKEIAEESGLPGRTVRYALKILGEEGIVEKRIYRCTSKRFTDLADNIQYASPQRGNGCLKFGLCYLFTNDYRQVLTTIV